MLDELDKYQQIKKEASSEALAEKRVTTWGKRARIWKISTPTVVNGPIDTAFKMAEARYRYYVICPHCGSELLMDFERICWPEDTDPVTLQSRQLGWYACQHCEAHWTDADRDKAVRLGLWREEVSCMALAEHLEATTPMSVGFHVPAWISPFVSLSEIAAKALAWETSQDMNIFKDLQNNYKAEAVYRKNSHIVKAMKWITALDNHVCPLCAVRDGVEWAMDEPLPPRHFRCRCVLVPVVRRDKLGVNDAQADAKVKPVMRRWVEREEGAIGAGGKRKILNSGKMVGSYEDWWKTLPEAKQAVTFGPVRTRLLREGNIAWGDLLEKGSGRLRTLDELGYTLSGESLHKKFARDVMPNLDRAVIPAQKIAGYSLNPDHSTGKDKARVLMKALGFTKDDAGYFSDKLLQGLPDGEIVKLSDSEYGKKWTVYIKVQGKNERIENVKTGWLYKGTDDFPSLVTAFLEGKKVKQ